MKTSQPPVIVRADLSGLRRAAKLLRAGGVVVFPTDTAYALGGLLNRPAVVRRILRIKRRTDRRFTVVAADLGQVRKFFKLPAAAMPLVKRYWPGPLSIVVNSRYAVRVPANTVTRQLCRLAGGPLIATSSNISGQATPYSSRAVMAQYKSNPHQSDMIINAGRLKKQKTSTVVQVVGNRTTIVRKGAVAVTYP